MPDIGAANIAMRKDLKTALRTLSRDFDILSDHAPVMMHAVDKDFRIVKVNPRWLERLGYEREEVLGRNPPDFATEESRIRSVNDTLPHFWRVGSARSVGYQLVRKDGQVADVLLDAKV